MGKHRVLTIFLILACLTAGGSGKLCADQTETASGQEIKKEPAANQTVEQAKKAAELKSLLVTDKEVVKKLEARQSETVSELKQTSQVIDKTKDETRLLLEKKKILEMEAQAKKLEAASVKEEAKAVSKEALQTGDAETIKKAAELSKEARKLESEARLTQEQAKVAELKAQASEQRMAANMAAIEAMKKELEEVRREKSARRGLIDKAVRGGVILLIGLALLWLLRFTIRRFELMVSEKDVIRESETTLRLKTLSSLFRWVGSLMISAIVLYMFFENFGIDMAPLLAGAGIIGLAFGFGGQYLIRDIINGIFILLEGQYRINDVVKIGDTGGLVESVNLRMTKLRDLEGRVIYIPNGEVKTVINFTQDFAQAVLNIGVAYKENVDHVMAVIKDVAAGMKQDPYYSRLLLDNLEMLGVDDFADSQVTIKCRFKTLPIKQWEVAREFRRRLKNKFDELGIEIPFPHRTLYWGTGAENQWMKEALQPGRESGRRQEETEG